MDNNRIENPESKLIITITLNPGGSSDIKPQIDIKGNWLFWDYVRQPILDSLEKVKKYIDGQNSGGAVGFLNVHTLTAEQEELVKTKEAT